METLFAPCPRGLEPVLAEWNWPRWARWTRARLPDLRGGEQFKLFDATTFSGGDFGYYDLPTLPAPLGWDYSLVPVNGTLKVAGKAFTIEPVTVSGTNLVVAVPTVAGSNYVLQVATNLTPTIYWMNQSTNAGTGSMLILNVPIESSKPQKFVRFWAY